MAYLCGLDLGQAQDYTALVIAEQQGTPASYDVRDIQRFSLGTTYPQVVQAVTALLTTPPLWQETYGFWDRPHTGQRRCALVMDATGVGRAVTDMFVAAGLHPIAVSIHGGDRVHHEGHEYHVPKRDLVGVVQVLLQTQRLRIARALDHAETLTQELTNFKVTIDPATAHDSYSFWREKDHDDLVLALALACWYGEYPQRAGAWGRS